MRGSFIAIFLLLISVKAFAVEQQQTAWQGDVDAFYIEDNALRHRDNGQGGNAHIYRSYLPKDTTSVSWSMECHFKDIPTRSNTFSFTLFAEENADYEYIYKVEPNANFDSLNLVREIRNKGNNSEESSLVSRVVLIKKTIEHKLLFWQDLRIGVDYSAKEGVRLRVFTSLEGTWQSAWQATISGAKHWSMAFDTKFTAQKKLNYSYHLPTISESQNPPSGETNPPLHILKYVPEDIGRVTLTLSEDVLLQSAEVQCVGYNPTLMPGQSSNELIINLGVPFAPYTTYEFQITGLKDTRGVLHALTFTLKTEGDSDGKTTIPEGVFITEVMVSPPTEGPLRGIKYIEVYNNSGAGLQLGYLTLLYGKTKIPLPHTILAAHSYAVLYPANDPYPTQLATLVPMDNFPTLSGNFTLILTDDMGNEYDRIHFTPHLYSQGELVTGASVERVTYRPDTWRRSNHPDGGTPGLPTTLIPYKEVVAGSVVINELLLSPPSTGEKYIELYNASSEAVNLADLYLSYSNKEESNSRRAWLLVKANYYLPSHSFVVLSPYPEALTRLYTMCDAERFIERINFPPLSATYTELTLFSHKSNAVVDQATYRKQWLGDKPGDRSGYSLERVGATANGTLRGAWRRALDNGKQEGIGGTPGVVNSADGLPFDDIPKDEYATWPTEEVLTYKQVVPLLRRYGDVATLWLYTLMGQPLMSVKGRAITSTLETLRQGRATLPTMIVVVHLEFNDPTREPSTLTYTSKWLHHHWHE